MKDVPSIKYLTDTELKQLFKALEMETRMAKTPCTHKCAIRNEALFGIMYYCGLRVSEVGMIKVEDFNTLKNEIYCRRLKGGINNTLEIIDSHLIKSLKRHIKENDPKIFLFESMKKNPRTAISRKTLDSIMRRCCEAAKIENNEKWHCHSLRHSRAIHLANAGADIREIQYWFGHVDISNTMIYLQFTSRHQQTLYDKLKEFLRNGF